ncbi:glycoside hydrolase family 68 protein [Halogeometricum sp. S1BR25-6]|uniref:Glycoside hydrolase family 68 protein n=1 Tax=Halogeometricum salsisoli TaxID=2950536 RepID=A0ABU2GGL4_9EURY|nr:glycoside hydrolase family 68 protein [Halogeometricum sp. S1BR25-6]MDS0299947.1 glycoside hydrolase family 68 protein [Halogeometricum sp. S1BR25-6]
MSGDDGPNAPDGRSAWTRDHAAELRRDETNVAPIIYPPADGLDEDLHVWDTWWLRDRDGSPAEVDGYRVILALTSSSDLLPGKRHDVATLRYFYSTDGKFWETGGRVFETGMLGSRQWAGSALHDDGDVYVYYTAAGEADEADLSYSQRIALAEGGTISPGDDGDGVELDGPWEHSVLLEPDGEWYEREAQSRGMTYTFRDPWFFEDEDGETYLLFEANTPVPEGSDACGGDAAQQEFNGSVGLAHSPTGDPTDFELRPPLLDAVCVNQELERPHLVVREGTYYLFVSSHHHTFAPGVEGYDALYGFAADGLRGEYEPLNGHGMVLTNPANAPFQAYSWLAYDHGDELLVTSFFNYFDYDRPSMDDVALLLEDEQMRRFGGTLAPTVRVGLDGRETRILGTLGHGHLPLAREALPADPFAGADGAGDGPRYY